MKHNILHKLLRQPDQPPSGGCVLKRRHYRPNEAATRPAAFGRLCVETTYLNSLSYAEQTQPPSGGCVLKLAKRGGENGFISQPPSGGCVLKPVKSRLFGRRQTQPPSGGCVLKLRGRFAAYPTHPQPPSGGCVLKRPFIIAIAWISAPAAFGRLCVETPEAS